MTAQVSGQRLRPGLEDQPDTTLPAGPGRAGPGRAGPGRNRVIIEGVRPQIDGGRFPIKRVVGDLVVVEGDIFTDGHDVVAAVLLYRPADQPAWEEIPMIPQVNDRWRGVFEVEQIGRYYYTLRAWVDHWLTWRRDLKKRIDAGQDLSIEVLIGADLIDRAAERASGDDRQRLRDWAKFLRDGRPIDEKVRACQTESLYNLVERYPDRTFATTFERELAIVVDREKARFSAWYEMFPRSAADEPGRHGTFRDVEQRLPYVAELGFDVLYLPPIHPIGTTKRKGKNNAVVASEGDVGSPWAIGGREGGHKAIHPELGTLDDFRHLVATARDGYGIDVALDIAFQCSPDHPYVHEHPEWFKKRPDGTIQYAENPPKKYEDIYPFDFETEAWPELWAELKGVFEYWIEQGVRIFRVDNPHTKSFPFWEWCIPEIKQTAPDVIFLSEAFTRPKIMYRLAKLGFTQSYTYFAWRHAKWELTQYLTELTRTEVRDYFRPNFWPNTPDILTEYLQHNGRPAFIIRLVLAATLCSNYGLYGPAFEHLEHVPRNPGSEEYLDSEKYQLRHWDLHRPDSLSGLIAAINHIRRTNPALQSNRTLRFHNTDNEQLLCYSKQAEGHSDIIVVICNLDPKYTQSGWVELPLHEYGISHDRPYEVHDLITNNRYTWHGAWNFVQLNPHIFPAHIFRLTRQTPTPMDFDAYLNLTRM